MRFLLDFALSAICAALCGMGVGGGGLLSVYLTLALSYPQIRSQGINIVFFIAAAAFSLSVHIKKRRFAALPLVFLISGALCGALCGALFAQGLRGELLRRLFGGFLLLCGILSAVKLIKKN